MNGKRGTFALARGIGDAPRSRWRRRASIVFMGSASLAVILATRAFGNPLLEVLAGNPWPALSYLFMALLWSGVALGLAAMGMVQRAVFYLLLFGLLLGLERLNFGLVSAPTALLLTNLTLFALVVETLVTVPLQASGRVAASRALSTAYQSVLIALPLVILAYNMSVGVALDTDALFAVYQTNLLEASGYVSEYFDLTYVLALAMVPVLLLVSSWGQHSRAPRFGVLFIASLCIVIPLAVAYQIPNYPTPRLTSLIKTSFVTYRHELAEFRAAREQRAGTADGVIATKSGPGETFIVVIGESQYRHNMSAYGYFRNTTPWLDAMSRDERLLLFENAYSNHTHTLRTLTLALTQASQSSDKPHYLSPSLIEIANAAAFETYWITNQVLIGGWDNLVTALAEEATHFIGLNRFFGRTARTTVHDGETIHVLRQVRRELDHRANNLVFIHLMGNHLPYCDRFPEQFAVFDRSDRFMFGEAADRRGFDQRINCYDNSMVYNDHVVARLFAEAQQIDNLAGFFYFVDHGQEVVHGIGHNSSLFQYEMARTPMYAWFSDAYRASRPERFERLRERRFAWFTNDLIFDTLIGLMGIETQAYDGAKDLSAAEYELNLDEASTLHGTRRIADDPHVVQSLFARGLPGGRVIAHRVNSLGKLHEAGRTGFAGVELDLMFRLREGGGYFELGHDDEHRTNGDLDAYLAEADEWGFSKLWLDVKNLSDENFRSALDELERLATRYPKFKAAALLESSTRERWYAAFAARGWHTSYYLPTSEVLEVMGRANTAALERLAESIARQVKAQTTAAVSFDVELYPFVIKHLQHRLDRRVVYHVWDLAIRAWEPDARQLLEAKPYYRDERIRTIIVGLDSPFSI